MGFSIVDGADRLLVYFVSSFGVLIVLGWFSDLVTIRCCLLSDVSFRLMLFFTFPYLVPVIHDLVTFPLVWVSGFVVCRLMVAILKSSVDLCLFRWEIKLRCVLWRAFFAPAIEDGNQDESFGISPLGRDFDQMVLVIIKKVVVLLSCESSFIESSSPVKAGAIVLLLRFDCPVEIWVKGYCLEVT